MDLSIIIVSWNVKELLGRLIDSIFHHVSNLDYEVIVVDNDSKDGTIEFLKNEYREWLQSGKLKLIANNANQGFSRANNQGFDISTGKYVVFMNPDMELTENSFSKLIEVFSKTPNLGLLTCRLLYPDKTIQPNVKGDPTFCSQFVIMLKLHHFLSWLPCLKKYFKKKFDYTGYAYVEQVMGAFVLTTREIFLKLHGWSEEYWIWWEDIDLCKRVRMNGLEIIYSPITEVIHYEGASFNQTFGVKKQWRYNKGMLIYFSKYRSFISYFVLIALQPLSLFLAFLTQLFNIKPRPQGKIIQHG